MKTSHPVTCTLLALIWSSVWHADAHAYSWATHKKMVGEAVSVMQLTQRVPDNFWPAPPGVDGPSWNAYLAAVRAAPDKLGLLRIGTLMRGGLEPDPAGNPPGDNLLPMLNDNCACQYRHYDNMNYVELNRIVDFWYVPQRNNSPCALQFTPNKEEVLGGVLGWHAAMVDDHMKDSDMWLRPLNSTGASWAKEAGDYAWKYGFLAPFATVKCLWDSLFGDGCDFEGDLNEFNEATNPEYLVEQMLPGVEVYEDERFATLWHFMNYKAGEYNTFEGLYYPDAGPAGPEGLDLAFMALGESGLSIDPEGSEGVQRYAQYDELHRSNGSWMSKNFALTEYSALRNMAQFGWNVFLQDPSLAWGLGWPLHTIADATNPHHVYGTSGHNHIAYEDFVEHNWDVAFIEDPQSPWLQTAQDQIILQEGYYHWSALKAGQSVRDFLVMLAHQARLVIDTDHSAFFFNAAEVVPLRRKLTDQGMGAMIALLTVAAEYVPNNTYDPRVKCNTLLPYPEHYEPGRGCVSGPSVCEAPPELEWPSMDSGDLPLECKDVGESACWSETEGDTCCAPLICENDTCIELPPGCKESGQTCVSHSECCPPYACHGTCMRIY